MTYELYSIDRKNGSMKKIAEGSAGALSKQIPGRRVTNKYQDYAVYHESGGGPVTSTYNGGANPHAWDTKESNKSRKRSGLSAYKR